MRSQKYIWLGFVGGIALPLACTDLPEDESDSGPGGVGPADASQPGDGYSPQADVPRLPITSDAGDMGPANPTGVVSIVFSEPVDRDLTGGIIRLAVDTDSQLPLRGVEFTVNGVRFDTDLLAPFEAHLDTTARPDEWVTLGALAVDIEGRSAQAEIEVLIDNSPPDIQLLQPQPREALFFGAEGFDIEVDPQDASESVSVVVTVNGIALPPGDGMPYQTHVAFEELMILPEDLPLDLSIVIDAVDGRGQASSLTSDHSLKSRMAWSFQTLGEIWAQPAVGPDGTVYMGSNDANLYAIRPDGTELWRYSAGAEVITRPAVDDQGRIYFGAGNHLVSLNPNGSQRWRFNASGAVSSSPALSPDQSTVYIGSYSEQVFAVNAEGGGQQWAFPAHQRVLSSPAVGSDGTIYIGSHDNRLYAINPDGSELWSHLSGDEVWGGAIVTQDNSIVYGSNDGFAYSLDAMGNLEWELNTRGQIWGQPVQGPDGTLYLGSTFRRLRAITPAGDELWQFSTGGLAQSSPTLDRTQTIYIGSTDQNLYAVSSVGQQRWAFRTDGEILASPTISQDQTMVYVGSTDRRMYAMWTGLAPSVCPPPEMVRVGTYEIMQYEASRPDATPLFDGAQEEIACSQPGVMPWVGVDWDQAVAACAAVEMRLCTISEWTQACRGEGDVDLPYGADPQPEACNGGDHPATGCTSGSCEVAATGTHNRCLSAAGAADMSGNVWEWTADFIPQPGEDVRFIRGGSFRVTDDLLRCGHESPDASRPANTSADDIGFRCCREAVDP